MKIRFKIVLATIKEENFYRGYQSSFFKFCKIK